MPELGGSDFTQTPVPLSQDAFLLKLNDALQPLADAVEIQRTAMDLTAEHFGVESSVYIEFGSDGNRAAISEGHRSASVPFPPEVRLSDFGQVFFDAFTAGRNISHEDMETDPRLIADRDAYRALNIRSGAAIPLIKGGRLTAGLALNHTEPRKWTAAEFQVLEEVAERTWAAVERARAEAALRESEGKYRALFNAINQGLAINQLVRDEDGRVVDARFLDLNPPHEVQSGGSHAATVGRLASELVPFLDPPWFTMAERVVETGQAERYESFVPGLERWFAFDMARFQGRDLFVVLYSDITEQKRTEAALREGEERQAFLLHLSDALRPLSDPETVLAEASRVLGEYLAVTRIIFAEREGDEFVIRRNYVNGVPSMVGRYLKEVLGQYTSEIYNQSGRVVIQDALGDPNLSEEEKAQFLALHIASYAGMVLHKNGGISLALVAHHDVPRAWTNLEFELIEETAERTWAAVERARTEEALRDSELRRELTIEAAGLGTYVWHVHEDRSEMDGRVLELLGVQGAGEVTLANALANLVHPDDLDAYAATAMGALDPNGDGKLAIETRIVRPDGALQWIAFTGQTVFEGEPRQAVRMYGTVAEVTERKRHETNLTFLAEVSQDLVGLTNIDEAMQTLCERISRHFAAAVSAFSEVDEAAGMVTILQSWHREDAVNPIGVFRLEDYHPGEVQQLMRSGRPEIVRDTASFPPEIAARHEALDIGAYVNTPLVREGAWRLTLSVTDSKARDWRDDELELMRELTTRIWNRIERDRAEAALRASQAQFSAVANLVPDLLWESGPDGTTTWYNSRWLEYTGQSFEQAIGWGWVDAIHPDDQDASAQRYQVAAEPGQPRRQEQRIRRYDGEYRWFAIDTVPVTNEHGQVVQIYGAASDIHDLRTLNSTLEGRVEERTRRLADLNAELGSLITRTAHNLEVPARQLSYLLTPDTADGSPALWDHTYDPGALKDEVARLKSVAQDLRQLSIIEEQPLDKEPLPLGELFAELSNTVSGKQATWFIQTLPIVRGNRALLKQALDVLMTFTLSETRGTQYVTVSGRQIEGEVHVTVQDDGLGLSGEEAATLFDLAVRTEHAVPVLEGGGLIQVRRVLARHGGWAWAESRLSSGKIVLAFPRDEEVNELEALFREDKPGM